MEKKRARVFVSSTFTDMQQERDILARRVFPRLRASVSAAVSLYEVDLRWGITQDVVENGQAVATCLQEVDDCWPLFVGILGERYGWRPAARDLDGLNVAGICPSRTPGDAGSKLQLEPGRVAR